MAELDVATDDRECRRAVLIGAPVAVHPGLLEAWSVSRQPARDRRPRWQGRSQSRDQSAAVDVQPTTQYQHTCDVSARRLFQQARGKGRSHLRAVPAVGGHEGGDHRGVVE